MAATGGTLLALLALLALVRADPVCRQLMSVPGVGAIVAITFKSGVDNPTRFKRSRDVGPHFGLTPRKWQRLS